MFYCHERDREIKTDAGYVAVFQPLPNPFTENGNNLNAIKNEILKKKNYWGDEQEQLVNQYVIEQDSSKKSLIYNSLSTSVRTLINGILYRYFISFVNSHNDVDLINDAETNLVQFSLRSFNPVRGKAYAYLGTSAKHYFHDRFLFERHTKRNFFEINTVALYDDELNILHDVEDVSKEDQYLFLVQDVKKLIDENVNDGNQFVANAVIELLLIRDWGRHYATYFLLKKTEIARETLYKYMRDLELTALIYRVYDLKFYDEIIDRNNLKTEGEIKEYLNGKIKIRDYKKRSTKKVPAIVG